MRCILLLAPLLLLAFPAWADDGPVPPPPPPPRVRYGEQTILVDFVTGGATVVLFAAGTEAKWAGAGAFVLGAPMVHVAHGQWPQMLIGIGARVVTPGVGCVLGGIGGLAFGPATTQSGGYGSDMEVGCAIGAVGGMIVASALDAALLAQE